MLRSVCSGSSRSLLLASRTLRTRPHVTRRFLHKDRIYKGSRCLGVVREVYNKWERRSPLCPQHVRDLVQQGYRVLVQPSDRRIFTNDEFREAGAIITDDLGEASVILGVKQVPVESLLPDRTYLFFSHVIKAQPENMALLDAVLAKRIRLIDYECITSSGVRPGRRLVAFGRYAGIAGMIDIFQGLGQHLLGRGFSTPFLTSPCTYMYPDLEAAKAGVVQLGHRIANMGLSPALAPMVFAFTGAGNVSQGAQEIFKLLPHEWVRPSDLPTLAERLRGDAQACRKLYGVVVGEEDLVERIEGGKGGFDRKEYRQHPDRYRAIFHERLAPYVSVLVNGVYWDARYPRLLTKTQMRELELSGRSRLLAVSDISCDVEGSLEFLTRTTVIERPFYSYLPDRGQDEDVVDGRGIVVSGVDILPSELPREASQTFGDALSPLLPHLASSEGYDPASPLDDLNTDLPPPLQGAVITANGRLTRGYEYISFLRKEKEREKKLRDKVHGGRAADQQHGGAAGAGQALPLMAMTLHGHLFDSGLINKVLDLIEARGGSFHISECIVRPNKGLVKHTSTVVVEVEAQSPTVLRDISDKVKTLISLLESAEASMTETYEDDQAGWPGGRMATTDTAATASTAAATGGAEAAATVKSPPPVSKVLVLGAGRVAGPAIEYLGRDSSRQLTIVGAAEKDTCAAAARAKWAKALVMDVTAEAAGVRKLVGEADLVVSLLPAGLHAAVARECVEAGVPLVTSSYVSDQMRALHEQARAKGVVLLNEAGLDPGMDHLSAMRIIDDAKARGGSVTSFRSVCGGLPAPEAANNPWLYKFSWQPRAVLSAAQQKATYKMGGVVVAVEGEHLLQSARPVDAWATLRLESLPNRNSLVYGDLYGIPEAATLVRGTLRYQGWSRLMHGCRQIGLFSEAPLAATGGMSWRELVAQSLGVKGGAVTDEGLEMALLGRVGGHERDGRKLLAALRWLGALSSDVEAEGGTAADAFVCLLEKRLRYEDDERDMVVMRHDIEVAMENGRVLEHHTSSLLAYGDGTDSAMARTVGLTCAMAAELVLQQEQHGDKQRLPGGVCTPVSKAVYEPLLAKLADEGLRFKEETTATVVKDADGIMRPAMTNM